MYTLAKHRPFDEEGKVKFLEDMIGWLDGQIDKKQKVRYRESVQGMVIGTLPE
ncbi:hypothetical protein ACE198_00350 [Neobacillus sp. KR4-4]|uniref:hypothetical protein n=1 Tax=Neobacillus sp. KR4-4 TaxID=3344872 RepID=UPI0035CA5A27